MKKLTTGLQDNAIHNPRKLLLNEQADLLVALGINSHRLISVPRVLLLVCDASQKAMLQRTLGVAPCVGNVLAEERLKIRHDPYKLSRLILSLTKGIHDTRDILPAGNAWPDNSAVV